MILPINKPIIHGRMSYAFPLSIISAYKQEVPWFITRLVDTYVLKDSVKLDFVSSHINSGSYHPLLDYKMYDKSEINPNDFLEFIIDCINSGNYVYTFCNKYYLPNSSSYGKYQYIHNILFYGYDNSRKLILGMTYNNDHYNLMEFKYDDLYASYLNCDSNSDPNKNYIYTMKKTNEVEEYDEIKLIRQLQSLLGPSSRLLTHGMALYKFLIDSLQEMFHLDKKNMRVLNNIHVYWEHKLLMSSRLQFMAINNNKISGIYEAYKEIEAKVLICRQLVLRYFYAGNKVNINRAIQSLAGLEERERILIMDLVRAIE